MRDKHYKVKQIRLSEEVWERLRVQKLKSGLTWNLFIKKLINKQKDL